MSKLVVSSSPHIRSGESVQSIMLDVIIALLPAGIASVWLFGIRSLLLIATCVITAVASEYIVRKILKRPVTIGDLSAVVTGLLLAYNLPPTLPLWMAAIGSAVAIIVVKQFFGGIGQNFVNPALIGRIVLMVSFSTAMTNWVEPFTAGKAADAVTAATPLAGKVPDINSLLAGTYAGCLGETCSIALLIGGVYLVLRRVITPTIPLFYLGTVAAVAAIAGQDVSVQLLSGGLLLGAIFMATDYSTSPVTFTGKIIYAIGCGLITMFIRLYGNLAEGVSYSIIIMNILTPHIERLTVPKPFGFVKSKKGE